MRIGLMLPGTGTVESNVDQIVEAERDGFDTVWFGQVFGPDVMTLLALAGPRTSRIELGTSVVPTYTRHPYVMAQQALTNAGATRDRFTLGIGLSHAPVVENMWGMSYEQPARHMREYLAVLQPLLREGRVSFSGETVRTNAGIAVPGAKPPPVLIAALAPLMLRIAGELTDGTITWMTGTQTIASHIVPRITAAAAGRPAPRIVTGLPVAVTGDVAEARERAAKAFIIYGQLPNYRRVLDREGAAGPADVAIVGDEASVERQLRDLASAGATDLLAATFPAGGDPHESLARTRALLQSLIGKI